MSSQEEEENSKNKQQEPKPYGGKLCWFTEQLPCASHCPRRQENVLKKSLLARGSQAGKTDKEAKLLNRYDNSCVRAMPRMA